MDLRALSNKVGWATYQLDPDMLGNHPNPSMSTTQHAAPPAAETAFYDSNHRWQTPSQQSHAPAPGFPRVHSIHKTGVPMHRYSNRCKIQARARWHGRAVDRRMCNRVIDLENPNFRWNFIPYGRRPHFGGLPEGTYNFFLVCYYWFRSRLPHSGALELLGQRLEIVDTTV